MFSEQDDLWFFVLVKSNNHSQNQDGELKLLNYHFFSELFPKKAGKIKSARLSRLGKDEAQFEFEDRGDSYYFEGGHFNTEQAVDESHPNGEYEFDIEFHSGRKVSSIMSLSGPEGTTDIPAPIRIFFHQQGKTVAQNAINPSLPLEVSWSLYSNGRFDPNGVVDDMIFVVFQSCQGERVFHTGLPFKEKEYTKFTTKKMTVPAGRFKPGQTYSMFVEFPHVVDSTIDDDVPGFTSYATATYTDINTTGDIEAGSCPEDIPPLDTGQTDRMDVEINE
ncbi:MAG: hypothetical protein GKR93_07335 [Gammaproteobacteria bacterium]|nr:hypothetical protein [Gammaproteobacteria bacterium]